MDAELLRYVKRALRKGYSEQRIVHQLTKQGWKRSEARQAIREAKDTDRSKGVILLGVVVVIVLAGITSVAWYLITASGDQAETDPEMLDPVNTSEENATNESAVNDTEPVVSECERRDGSRAKFSCYQSKLRSNLTSVDCRLLPQPDRRLCTHAYEQAAVR